jgi:hypothetical protein
MAFTNSKPRRSHWIEYTFFFLLLTISLLLILNGFVGLALLVFFGSFSIVWFTTAWFTKILIPEISYAQILKIQTSAFFSKSLGKPGFIKVINGQLENETFDLNPHKGPAILAIDQKSAAIVINTKKEFRILLPGIHPLARTSTLFSVFSTTPQKVTFGQESQDDLSPQGNTEGMADYHVRINKAKRTRTLSSDAVTIFPKIEVFYTFDVYHQANEVLSMVIGESGHHISSSLRANKSIEEVVFQSTMSEWKNFSSGKTAGQLCSEVPHRLFPNGIPIRGLAGMGYISGIYSETSEKIK